MKKFPLALSVALCGTVSLFAGDGTGTATFMDTIKSYWKFYGCLLAAFICYGILLAVSRLAPPEQKRFLFFITLATMVFLLLAIPFSNSYHQVPWAMAALVFTIPFFIASFYQFFIRGFDGRFAAAAIVLQILGIGFALGHLAVLIKGLA